MVHLEEAEEMCHEARMEAEYTRQLYQDALEQEIEQYKAKGKDKGDDKDKYKTNIGGAGPKLDKEGDQV